MTEQTPEGYLQLAEEHLERAQAAWYNPTDWAILASFGLYCIEAAVMAASNHFDMPPTRNHAKKAEYADELHQKHDMPNVALLMRDLNAARKAAAYGDIEAPDLDAEDLVNEIENYVNAIRNLIRK